MDPARPQFPGFWFVCKYCQRVFRDKLELFCHQVNDHPEYRDELNGQRNIANTHEMVYSDPRATTVEKRQGNNFVQGNQQHSSGTSGWYPPSAGHIPNHAENQNYYTNPVEYYVVVPNQSPNHGGNSMAATPVSANQVMNIPVPIVNQQIAHSSSIVTSCQPQTVSSSQGNNLVTLRNEGGSEWNKIGGDSSDTDTTSSGPNKDDLDYYCWKCKVKFGNAAAYIAHSSSCFPPANDSYENSANNADHDHQAVDRYSHSNRKRGRKPRIVEAPVPQPQHHHQHHPQIFQNQAETITSTTSTTTASKRRKTATASVIEEVGVVTPTSSKARRKGPSQVSSTSSPLVNNTASAPSELKDKTNGAASDNVKSGVQDKSFSCSHCNLKFSSNDRLTSHLLQCKSKKNPYETYQYKCIKCSESFDIYLQYKRHIEIHTGAIRYS